jgi:hypothetical protein
MKVAAISAVLASTLFFGAQAADIGVSVGFSEPGVYGRVDIGRFPQPGVIASQPIIAAAPTVAVNRSAPIYMWVPPAHRVQWRQYCHAYNACRAPVYFVRDDWYNAHVRHAHHGPVWREEMHGHCPARHDG